MKLENEPCVCGHQRKCHATFEIVHKQTNFSAELSAAGISLINIGDHAGYCNSASSSKEKGIPVIWCCNCPKFKLDNLEYLKQVVKAEKL